MKCFNTNCGNYYAGAYGKNCEDDRDIEKCECAETKPITQPQAVNCISLLVCKDIDHSCWIAKERDQLLELTRTLDDHPQNYNGPCECSACMSYAAEDR